MMRRWPRSWSWRVRPRDGMAVVSPRG
jgi:hypothetical protein